MWLRTELAIIFQSNMSSIVNIFYVLIFPFVRIHIVVI